MIISTIDRCAKSYGISGSKIVSDLLGSTSPAPDYLVSQNSLKNEMETKLLSLFAYELKEVEAKLAKDEVLFRHFNQGIKKLSYVVMSRDAIQFSLPDRKHWPGLRGLFQGKVNKMLDIYRPCDSGHCVCILYPDHLKVETRTSTVISFRSLIIDDYFFDINSLCFVREGDFFYYGINEYMERNLENRNRLHLSWVSLKEVDDGYLFMAAVRKENLKYAVRKKEGFIVNFPCDVWEQ